MPASATASDENPSPPRSDGPALRCRSLVRSYGDVIAVDGLDLEVVALVGFGRLVFGVKVHGSFLALSSILLLGAVTFAALGVLVAARPRTIEAVSGWMNFVMLPMWLLSGSFFSYSRFPEPVQPLIRLLPLTAANDALRAIMNDGAPLRACGSEVCVLLVWGVASLVVALKIFRWQ